MKRDDLDNRSGETQGPEIRYQAVTPRLLVRSHVILGHGKFDYCSCMRWRMKSTEYQKSTKETRAAKLKKVGQ